MNFQVLFSAGTSPANSSLKIINASSWSTCLAYCEGTGVDIGQILYLANTEVVVNDETTTNCFQVTLKSSTTQLRYNYVVFDTSYNTLQTWINTQTNKLVVSINLQQITYVVV
tara:strand:+ start:317 stop:655 length:339 start_codon:yes stop_codon:yes gene_type:complete